MRVGLYGGSFDPPHLGHTITCYYLLESLGFDQVWVIPCWEHPFEKTLTPFDDRYEMCHRAFAILGPRVIISNYESRQSRTSWTINTVRYFVKTYAHINFEWVVGSDAYATVDQWKESVALKRMIPFHVVPRGSSDSEKGVVIPPIESHRIRERIADGRSFKEFLPRDVVDYITTRKLYGWKGDDV